MAKDKRILIVGAGPTGLGAAWRLHELGHENWTLIEATDVAGGLAGSVTDAKGYTWDHGGHVQFSHYEYFDRLMDDLKGDAWIHHERESWVWIAERFVPYPFQNNIRRLPREALWECVEGLLNRPDLNGRERPGDFEAFIRAYFGEGLAKHFMMPYNFKVWAHPPRLLNTAWVGERVAPVDLARVIRNIILERDHVSWGPNNTFRFPEHGGTGSIWRALAKRIESRIHYGTQLTALDTRRRVATLSDGSEEPYDALISSVPLDVLVSLSDRDDLRAHTDELLHSATHVIGVGVKGQPGEHISTKCWMYFPEDNCPFYRVTVFSNYSPNNVPDISRGWSLMAEVSESEHKPVDSDQVVEETLAGMEATRLIESRDLVENVYHRRLPRGYPVPGLGRDGALEAVLPALDAVDVFSRGRFGGWKYEVSNQDHALMQGVEVAERTLRGAEEETLWKPDFVNGGGARGRSVETDAVQR